MDHLYWGLCHDRDTYSSEATSSIYQQKWKWDLKLMIKTYKTANTIFRKKAFVLYLWPAVRSGWLKTVTFPISVENKTELTRMQTAVSFHEMVFLYKPWFWSCSLIITSSYLRTQYENLVPRETNWNFEKILSWKHNILYFLPDATVVGLPEIGECLGVLGWSAGQAGLSAPHPQLYI